MEFEYVNEFPLANGFQNFQSPCDVYPGTPAPLLRPEKPDFRAQVPESVKFSRIPFNNIYVTELLDVSGAHAFGAARSLHFSPISHLAPSFDPNIDHANREISRFCLANDKFILSSLDQFSGFPAVANRA